MPAFDTTTPTLDGEYAGYAIKVPAPYAEGHHLTAAEAKGLNRFVATAVGNAFAAIQRREREKAPGWVFNDPQAAFDDIYADYQLGVSNRGGGTAASVDPVEVALQSIASAAVKAILKAHKKNIREAIATKVAGSDISVFSNLVAQWIERNPAARDQAIAQVEAMAELTDAAPELDLSDLDGLSDTKSEEAEAAAE